MSNDKTIHMGIEAFNKLKESIGILYGCNEVRHQGITYRLDNMLDPFKCVTLDKDLVRILKDSGMKPDVPVPEKPIAGGNKFWT